MSRPRTPAPRRSLPRIELVGGPHIEGSTIWFDAATPVELCFVSHAHLPTPWQHRRVLATDRTVKLYGEKLAAAAPLVCSYRRPFALGDLEIELFPAGHMLGSAQIRVRTPRGDVVYTGDFTLESTRTAERAQVVPCDVLVLDATYGNARYVFPPRAEIEGRIATWAAACLEREVTPVFFVSEVGKAQEVLKILGAHGIATRVHASVYAPCRVYQENGVDLPGVKRFQGTPAASEAVIFPARLHGSRAIHSLRRLRTAAATGRALDPRARAALRVDEAFPLSGHADFPSLLQYAELARPRRVYSLGPHASDLALALRARGVEASPLLPPQQMDLFGS